MNVSRHQVALIFSQIFGWCLQETPKSAILEGSDNTIKQTIKAVCGCGDNYRITWINVVGSITPDRGQLEKYRDSEIRSFPIHKEFHSNADTIYSSKCSD